MLHEFRQDPLSGDWVLFSTERAQKPHSKEEPLYQSKEVCVFEPERLAEQENPVLVYGQGAVMADLSGDWTTVVIPNKFPALKKGVCSPVHQQGLFAVAEGAGFHELVVTRDHDRSFAQFTTEETSEVIQAYRTRYQAMSADGCGAYISIFHNHGHLAGASVFHNHSQIMSVPMVPSVIARHLESARQYFDKTGTRLHDALLEWELKQDKRIVYQNDYFVVLCPYVSRTAYEMKIFPKTPHASFGDISDAEIPYCAEALNVALAKLSKALGNPDYAFLVHTAPPAKESETVNNSYQWNIEIMPRFTIDAGLELETNVQVNTVDPDEAAKLLRETA